MRNITIIVVFLSTLQSTRLTAKMAICTNEKIFPSNFETSFKLLRLKVKVIHYYEFL